MQEYIDNKNSDWEQSEPKNLKSILTNVKITKMHSKPSHSEASQTKYYDAAEQAPRHLN